MRGVVAKVQWNMGSRKRKWEEDYSFVGSKSASQATIGATDLCELCHSMTSTKEGLCAIAEGGYVHHNITELEYSARYGCSLCRMIYNGLQQTPIRTNESIQIIGTLEESSYRAGLLPGNSAYTGHPFAGKTLVSIEVFSTTSRLVFEASTPSSKSPKQYIIIITIPNFTEKRAFKLQIKQDLHIFGTRIS
jgi:hypothetical protein